MVFQDDNKTAILKDTSIVVFHDNGDVSLYPSVEWIKPRNNNKQGFGHCHNFKYESKNKAIEVFIELEKNMF